jgi:hypothetical protein
VDDDPIASSPISGIEGCGGDGTVCTSASASGPEFNSAGDEATVTYTWAEGITKITDTGTTGAVFLSVTGAGGETFSETSTGVWELGSGQSVPTEVKVVFGREAGASSAQWFVEIAGNSTDYPDNTACPPTNLDPVLDFPARSQPVAFGLEGNYPNPFAGQTTIAFALAEASEVQVSVYDVLGRKVATVVDKAMSAGTHQVSWDGQSDDGRRLASGAYFYRIEAGDYAATRRLTIVR